MTAYLHIGTAKTGTTTIQHFFSGNRPALKAQGYLYPRCLGAINHELAAVYGADFHRRFTPGKAPGATTPEALDALRDELRGALAAEIAEAGCPHLLISNEHLFQKVRDAAEAERIKEMLGPLAGDVRIVVYLRRQDEFAASEFCERVRMGYDGTLERYLAAGRTRELLDYERNLRGWIDVFGTGRITLRVFDRDRLEGGDTLVDLCKLIGLDLGRVLKETGKSEAVRQREGLDASRTLFLRNFNREVAAAIADPASSFTRDRFASLAVRGPLIRSLEEGTPRPKFRLPTATAQQILEAYRPGNDRLFGRFGMDGFTYTIDPRKAGATLEDSCDIDEFFRYFARIWLDAQNEIATLRERAKAKTKAPA